VTFTCTNERTEDSIVGGSSPSLATMEPMKIRPRGASLWCSLAVGPSLPETPPLIPATVNWFRSGPEVQARVTRKRRFTRRPPARMNSAWHLPNSVSA